MSPVTKLDYERDLGLFRSEDESIADEALQRLWGRTTRSLGNRLARNGVSPDDVDDLLQDVWLRLWENRHKHNVQTAGAWWALVRTISRNLMIDLFRKHSNNQAVTLEEENEIPEKDIPFLDEIVVASFDVEMLYAVADDVWLGEAPGFDNDALLGVQYHLVDGFDCQTAANMAGVKPEQIAQWIEDPAVLLRVAYRNIFWTNDELAGFILRPQDPYKPPQLDGLIRMAREAKGSGIEGWDWNEVLVILLRLRNGLHTDQILRFEKCGMDGEGLETVFRRVLDRFPFRQVANDLREKLRASDEAPLLAEKGLWRRLAFQYHVSSELPNRQIQERTEPAAATVGVQVTDAMLNNWIGLGRLWSQLAVHVRRRQAA